MTDIIGHDVKGEAVQEVILRNAAGARASILSWGAVVRDLEVPMPDGSLRRVVLGFADIADYGENGPYLGALCGRVCNRIAQGRFRLEGRDYQLPINAAGEVSLHGGIRGFTRRNWQVVEATEDSVLLRLVSPDGEEGYPGTVTVDCRYTLTEDNALRMELSGTSDAVTLLNLTNHSYFTLAEGAQARDHWLEVDADFYTPTLPNLINTGEVTRVEGTVYDFRALSRLGANHEVNFVLKGPRGAVVPVARLRSPDQDLELEVATDQPGLLLYCAEGLAAGAGTDGQKLGRGLGVCLEAAGFCDSVNQRHLPSPVLRPGETYRNICEYRFRAL